MISFSMYNQKDNETPLLINKELLNEIDGENNINEKINNANSDFN